MQLGAILQLLVLLAAANGAPVLAKKILGPRFMQPLDGGRLFVDGRPLFGTSKTIRGIVVAILASTLAAPLLGLDWATGLRVGVLAMLGDLMSSFVKRRLALPSSSMALGIDQVPESLFPTLACRALLSLSVVDIVATVAAFFIGELLLSRLLYRLHIRDRPY
jgi:CDP-archaeol synthase